MERIAGPDTPPAIKIGMPRQTTIDVADATGHFLIERKREGKVRERERERERGRENTWNITCHECNLRELIGTIPAFVTAY